MLTLWILLIPKTQHNTMQINTENALICIQYMAHLNILVYMWHTVCLVFAE